MTAHRAKVRCAAGAWANRRRLGIRCVGPLAESHGRLSNVTVLTPACRPRFPGGRHRPGRHGNRVRRSGPWWAAVPRFALREVVVSVMGLWPRRSAGRELVGQRLTVGRVQSDCGAQALACACGSSSRRMRPDLGAVRFRRIDHFHHRIFSRVVDDVDGRWHYKMLNWR